MDSPSVSGDPIDYALVLLECAREHGENSEPDHEVGDIRTFFLACWAIMTPGQRTIALMDPRVQDVLEGPEYGRLFD